MIQVLCSSNWSTIFKVSLVQEKKEVLDFRVADSFLYIHLI